MYISLVLNLVISGIPSIPNPAKSSIIGFSCFKPCYKWNTFNTLKWMEDEAEELAGVLNLVISGIPSILKIS